MLRLADQDGFDLAESLWQSGLWLLSNVSITKVRAEFVDDRAGGPIRQFLRVG